VKSVQISSATDAEKPFCMSVQWVDLDFRRFSGLILTTRRRPARRSSASRVRGGISSSASRECPLAGDRRHPRIYPGPKNQKPAVLWFTGLSGAGKSTIANLVGNKLGRMNRHTFLVDGDNVRHGLNKDLGFTDADRTTLSIRLSITKHQLR
jgi:Mrp family chromosome partitioning ATPase